MSRARIDGDQRGIGAVVRHHRGHGDLGGLLDCRVEGGEDAQAAPGQQLPTFLGVGAQCRALEQPAPHLVGEVGVAHPVGMSPGEQRDGLLCGAQCVTDLDPAELEHHIEDDLAALECGLEVVVGVEVGGGSNHPGEQGRLAQRELRHGLAEVALGGGAGSEGALAEEDGVQVSLEDLLLGEGLLDL